MMIRKNHSGFTLVELLIVIAVLGLIVAIAVPRLMGVASSAENSADTEQAKLVANNVRMLMLAGAFTETTKSDLTEANGVKVTTADYGEDYPTCQETGNLMIAYYTKRADGDVHAWVYSSDSANPDGDKTGSALADVEFEDVD